MRKHTRLVALIGCFLLFSVSLVLVFRRKPEPIYNGFTLSYWAGRCANSYAQLEMASRRPSIIPYIGVNTEAEEAIRAMGTNVFPFVLKWLHSEQDHSTVRLFYSLRVDRLPFLLSSRIHRLVLNNDAQRRAQEAFYVMQILGPQSNPLAPELLQLCNNPAEPDTAYRCFVALGALGTNALLQLMQVLRDMNHPYRGAAVRQLEEVLKQPSPSSLQLPVLLECLHDRDSSLVTLVCQLLGERVQDRVAIVPILRTKLLSPDPSVRIAASNALFAISSTSYADPKP